MIEKYKKISTLGILIFISASPLFENLEKIIFSTIVILIYMFANISSYMFTRKNLLALFLFFFVLVLYSFLLDTINGLSIDYTTIGFYYLIFIAFLLANLFTTDDMLLANEKLVYLSILLGLPLFLISIYYPGAVGYAFDYTYGDTSHKTLGFINFHIWDGAFTDRFVGFGREPGLTQVFYLLALWYRLKSMSGNIDFTSVLMITAIYFGMSTAGLFTMFMVLVVSIPNRKLLYYGVLASPLIFSVVYNQIVYHFDNKLYGSLSFASRYDRYNDFFSSDLTTILFGYGNAYYTEYISKLGLGGWDTVLQFSQRFGFLSFIFIVILLFYNNLKYPMIAVIIALGFFSQSMWFYPVVAFFFFSRKTLSDCTLK